MARRPVFADPKTDFTFHRIFGSEKHKPALIGFLNDILALDDEHRVVEVVFLDPTQRPKVEELKLSIVDVKCKDARGVQYVVEMQVLNVEAFDKRVVYNVAKAYTNQLDVGDGYPKLNDIVGITICDFEMWPQHEGYQVPMVSRWKLQEQSSGTVGLLALQFVFLELPKYDVEGPPQTSIEKWAYFFREARNLEMVPEALQYPPIVEALDAARTAAFSADEWDAYIRAGMAIQNERGMLSLAEKQGHKKGLDEGLKKGLKKGLDEGLKKGLDEGLKKGLQAGLRQAIRDLCDVLGIEYTSERNAELERLDADALSTLRDRIKSTKTWS
ncbi:MAG TPA: Rpn family recombination-promoting nuclease/putative transposase [Polyangium sp.]|nr:Rpn family recombination-promoting nuclease/putative transposase [Polyangium sp.]